MSNIQELYELLKDSQIDLNFLNDTSNKETFNYETKLKQDMDQKIQFLKQAETRLSETKTNEDASNRAKIIAYLKTLDKLPFMKERDDLIDVSLASVILNNQVQQSETLVKKLKQREESLDEDIQFQENYGKELRYIIEKLKESLESDEFVVKDESIATQLESEKKRYRQLRIMLRELQSDTYLEL